MFSLAKRGLVSQRGLVSKQLLRRMGVSTRLQQKANKSVNTFTSNMSNTSPTSESSRLTRVPPVMQSNGRPQIAVDKELPYPYARRDENRKYFVIFAVGITVACAVIFNYEKSSSPIVGSVLYYLRRSTVGQDALGGDIEFASSWPWIWGTLNTVQGHIDIKFKVKGSEQSGWLILKANRESKRHPFIVDKFLLEVDSKDAKVQYDLMTDPEYEFDL
ncbi:uncharacterized protein LODBEIA_P52090 [Lodderomyces beijingensis]|uniref:DUF1783-domain-containing protein n=1 Tax=Lodderomyces beijingensis TaxID=1775926 RepID=A0ABP0ZUX6_9ASCO